MNDIIHIETPITSDLFCEFMLGMRLCITGCIITGRDAALPRLLELITLPETNRDNIELIGSVILHTAVSHAGIGPTSSNKLEIESSIPELSKAGVKMHIGKGRISSETVKALDEFESVYAITPPLSALLTSKIISQKVLAFPEEGMEALHLLEVVDFPVIIAAINGKSIYD